MLHQLDDDVDILREKGDFLSHNASNKPGLAPVTFLPLTSASSASLGPLPFRHIPLVMNGGSYMPSQATADLLREIGGGGVIRSMTHLFYTKALRDPALEKFIAEPSDPHGQRLGNWMVEKMGGEGPCWTEERVERAKCPVARLLSNGVMHVAGDRSSSHVAAWWSLRRPAAEAGKHFQMHDCRVWMRLMFWSARETGLFDKSPTFESWFIRFIAHFVRVYEAGAPPFALESARWSLNPGNLQAYEVSGWRMEDVVGRDGQGLIASIAASHLSVEDRHAVSKGWPYEMGRK